MDLGKVSGMASAYFTDYAKTLNWVLFSELIDDQVIAGEKTNARPFKFAHLPENVRNSIATIKAPTQTDPLAGEAAQPHRKLKSSHPR